MRTTAELPRLWATAEVAEYLGVPVATLYAWRRRGIGPPAIPVGRYLRYDPTELQAWLDRRREAS